MSPENIRAANKLLDEEGALVKRLADLEAMKPDGCWGVQLMGQLDKRDVKVWAPVNESAFDVVRSALALTVTTRLRDVRLELRDLGVAS